PAQVRRDRDLELAIIQPHPAFVRRARQRQERGERDEQQGQAPAAARDRPAHIVWVGFSAASVPASRVSIRFLTASPSGVSANCTPTPAVRAPWAPVGVTQTTLPATGRRSPDSGRVSSRNTSSPRK